MTLSFRCYAANREKPYLIFEDLCDKGFKNVNRRTGLDVSHYRLVLNIVAKYHAATAVLVEKVSSNTIKFWYEAKFIKFLMFFLGPIT